MRAFDRDLIRGGHYGQRSCEPHLKAEHTGAPTNAANVKKVLANSEPSTHGGKPDVLKAETNTFRAAAAGRIKSARRVEHFDLPRQRCGPIDDALPILG